MSTGLLTVTGTLALDQFWPQGSSDADTAKIVLAEGAGAFQFEPSPGAAAVPTSAFRGAKVRGKSGAKPAIDKQNRITVRLQGIDAPELHYRPSPLPRSAQITEAQRAAFKKLNLEYRQHFGKQAAKALGDALRGFGQDSLPCTVVTAVEHPNDVFDTYARFIGDILVQLNGQPLNINRWLVEQGWAFPAFYDSMTAEEIRALLAAAKKGRTFKKRLWPQLAQKFGAFNFKLLSKDAVAPEADAGPVAIPKLFRRHCSWACRKAAQIPVGGFKTYLAEDTTDLYLTKQFLKSGPKNPHKLAEYFSGGVFSLGPGDMVFHEDRSTLIGPDGQPVTAW